jgi:hypothetical protein
MSLDFQYLVHLRPDLRKCWYFFSEWNGHIQPLFCLTLLLFSVCRNAARLFSRAIPAVQIFTSVASTVLFAARRNGEGPIHKKSPLSLTVVAGPAGCRWVCLPVQLVSGGGGRPPPLCAPGSLSNLPPLSPPRSLSSTLRSTSKRRSLHPDFFLSQPSPSREKPGNSRPVDRRSPHRPSQVRARIAPSALTQSSLVVSRLRRLSRPPRRRPVRFVPGLIGPTCATRSEWVRSAGTGASRGAT